MDRLLEGDRFCNRPTVSLQFGPHHHVKITSCYPANFSSQVGSSCWTRLPWIILGIGVGISNMVYPTYTLKMADSNVRDALTTLSILFESLMSFSIGSFVRDPRRDSSVRIDIVHLVARNFPRENFLSSWWGKVAWSKLTRRYHFSRIHLSEERRITRE